MKIKSIISELEKFAPLTYQEEYDNSGLLVGDKNNICKAVLLSIDVTEEVVDEAIRIGANLIISHHPIIFSGLKKITGENYIQRTVIKALKNDIAIYASHTNMDNVYSGVNGKICEKIGLTNCQILQPTKGNLKKLVTFIPEKHADIVRNAVFEAGAGNIGNYDFCSYNSEGKGSFRASDKAEPFVGEKNQVHYEKEIRFETIFPVHLKSQVIAALMQSHPYEEVAYDIYPLDNKYDNLGAGMIGNLEQALDEKEFLTKLKTIFNVSIIRHTPFLNKKIKKVALCGGSGNFLLQQAISKNADVFISGDFKYHQFFDAEHRILVADIGHFESEQYTKDLFYDILTKKFPNFAIHFSEINTNPINYF